ncbi:MAG TPA: TerB family tellurite resistance protein [Psychrobacter pasteurii]|nr:TerB family tellurite resistance protein [Psychrobacter pasteurii]
MAFIFNVYLILFLIMPFVVIFWLIRPAYFPFVADINNPPSRLKILGLSSLVFMISTIIIGAFLPEESTPDDSVAGLLAGLILSITIIYLSIKQGKSAPKIENNQIKNLTAKPLFNMDLQQIKPPSLKLNKTPDKETEVKKKRSFFEQRRVRSETYKQLMLMASDGEISQEEEERIKELLMEAELTDKQELKGFIKAYKKAYEHVVSDDVVTDQEDKALERIQRLFNIPSDMIAAELQVLDKHKLLRQIQSGILPTCHTNIILKKDEVAHFSYFADLIEERAVRGRYQGGSAGVSIRVAKGVSFRVGQSRGTYQSDREPVAVSSGKLIVTNKRIIFDGDKKSFNITIGQLLSYEVFDNSILVKPTRGNPRLVELRDTSYDPDILDMGINSIVYS